MPPSAAAHVVMNSERWIVLLIGLVVSFIVALGVVEWFLYWVRKHGFTMFAIYRILARRRTADLGRKNLRGIGAPILLRTSRPGFSIEFQIERKLNAGKVCRPLLQPGPFLNRTFMKFLKGRSSSCMIFRSLLRFGSPAR